MALWTLVAYCVVGAVVASALTRRNPVVGAHRAGTFVLHAGLWPLFVPLLLPPPAPVAAVRAADPYEPSIAAAEKALKDTLLTLGRDLDDPLSLEAKRVRDLGHAMRTASARLGELDALLGSSGQDEAALAAELARLQKDPEAASVAEIVEQRLGHVRRLRELRRQTQRDLERAIARAGELSTRLTLLRYEDPARTGVAASKARELTDAIEDLCRVLTEVRAA